MKEDAGTSYFHRPVPIHIGRRVSVLFRVRTGYHGAMRRAQTGSALRSSLTTLGVISVLLAIAFAMLPEGYSTDLSRIGQGSNAVVLVHNREAAQSLELMALLDQVRPDYSGRVEFLVVEAETEQGKAFMRQQQVGGGLLLLFGPDGVRRGTLVGVHEEQALRAAFDNAFGPGRR